MAIDDIESYFENEPRAYDNDKRIAIASHRFPSGTYHSIMTHDLAKYIKIWHQTGPVNQLSKKGI